MPIGIMRRCILLANAILLPCCSAACGCTRIESSLVGNWALDYEDVDGQIQRLSQTVTIKRDGTIDLRFTMLALLGPGISNLRNPGDSAAMLEYPHSRITVKWSDYTKNSSEVLLRYANGANAEYKLMYVCAYFRDDGNCYLHVIGLPGVESGEFRDEKYRLTPVEMSALDRQRKDDEVAAKAASNILGVENSRYVMAVPSGATRAVILLTSQDDQIFPTLESCQYYAQQSGAVVISPRVSTNQWIIQEPAAAEVKRVARQLLSDVCEIAHAHSITEVSIVATDVGGFLGHAMLIENGAMFDRFVGFDARFQQPPNSAATTFSGSVLLYVRKPGFASSVQSNNDAVEWYQRKQIPVELRENDGSMPLIQCIMFAASTRNH